MQKSAVECTECEAAAPIPQDGDHRPLWETGWRWIASQGLFSCPDCPPVVLQRDGRHLRGPGQLAPTG